MKWTLGLAVLLCVACLPLGCSDTRWKAEDGTTEVWHGLEIRFGTTFYIGDGGKGKTTAQWTAEGGSDMVEEPIID